MAFSVNSSSAAFGYISVNNYFLFPNHHYLLPAAKNLYNYYCACCYSVILKASSVLSLEGAGSSRDALGLFYLFKEPCIFYTQLRGV